MAQNSQYNPLMTTANLFALLLLLMPVNALAHDDLLQEAAIKYKLPYKLLKAISIVESSGNPNAVNAKTGDYGLMQLNKNNLHAWNISPEQALNPVVNIDLASKLLIEYKRRFGHENGWECRYNVGTARNVSNWTTCKIYLQKLANAGYIAINAVNRQVAATED